MLMLPTLFIILLHKLIVNSHANIICVHFPFLSAMSIVVYAMTHLFLLVLTVLLYYSEDPIQLYYCLVDVNHSKCDQLEPDEAAKKKFIVCFITDAIHTLDLYPYSIIYVMLERKQA